MTILVSNTVEIATALHIAFFHLLIHFCFDINYLVLSVSTALNKISNHFFYKIPYFCLDPTGSRRWRRPA